MSDKAEGIDSIRWSVYGKILEIKRNNQGHLPAKATRIRFFYDAMGNRIGKEVTESADKRIYTWYVRDAQGNVMSTYTQDSVTGVTYPDLLQRERHIYGSSRLGVNFREDIVSGGPVDMDLYYYGRVFRRKYVQYELSNHLGNVLTTITDKKNGVSSGGIGSLISYYEPDIVSATEYYPFGMPMRVATSTAPSGVNYRYGFNGKEYESEGKGFMSQQDYGMRIYDPRIGRFLSEDPITKQYPDLTPYQFASNSPIEGIDQDGLEFLSTHKERLKEYGRHIVLDIQRDQKNREHYNLWKIQSGPQFIPYKTPTTEYHQQLQQNVNERNWLAAGYNRDGTLTPMQKFAKNKYYQNFANNVALPVLEGYGYLSGIMEARAAIKGLSFLWKSTNKLKFSVRLASADEVNSIFTSKGLYSPYQRGATVGEFNAPTNLDGVVRLSGLSNVEGNWFTTMEEIKGLTPVQLKNKFALKYEPTNLTPVTINQGSTIRVGTAAPVIEFNATGGGFQIELLNGKVQYGKTIPLK